MRRLSALGKKTCAALVAAAAVLLLSAPPALASRTASQRPELLASPALQPIAATPALAPTYTPQGFALRLDTDPHPATFALFNDLTPAPERVEPENLASGVESWALTPNLQRLQIVVADSRWCREFLGPIDSPNLYQAFGLDPMNMTDPLGLSSVCDWYKVNGGTPPPECPATPMVPLAGTAPAPPLRLPQTSPVDRIKPGIADQVKRGIDVPSMSAGPPDRGLRGDVARGSLVALERTGRGTANLGILLTWNFGEVATGQQPTAPPFIPELLLPENERQEDIATAEQMLLAVYGTAKGLPGGGMAPASSMNSVNPYSINFSQRTVGTNATQYVDDMAAGQWDWQRSGPLRVMNVDGQLVSYDNRRLLAAQRAGLSEVPIERVNPTDLMPGSNKTWADAFAQRFNDPRNVAAGDPVPPAGLPTQPQILPPRPRGR